MLYQSDVTQTHSHVGDNLLLNVSVHISVHRTHKMLDLFIIYSITDVPDKTEEYIQRYIRRRRRWGSYQALPHPKPPSQVT